MQITLAKLDKKAKEEEKREQNKAHNTEVLEINNCKSWGENKS